MQQGAQRGCRDTPRPGNRRVPWASDDRVVCGGCFRSMVPRVLTYRGDIQRTVCPFCGVTYLDFTPDLSVTWRMVGWTVLVALCLAVLLTLAG